MRTEAWWVCACGKPICRVGRGQHTKKWQWHLMEGCDAKKLRDSSQTQVPFGMGIEQLPQKKTG